MDELTQARLKELLDYDPETGVFRWRVPHQKVRAGDVAGHINSEGYRNIQIGGKVYKAHRLAWLYVYGHWPDGDIDHINGIRDANGIENLRVAKNHAEQGQNRKLSGNNTSGYPGVCWYKQREQWGVRIIHNGEQHFLGLFNDPEEAAEAYRKAKLRLHKFCPEVRDFSYERAGAC